MMESKVQRRSLVNSNQHVFTLDGAEKTKETAMMMMGLQATDTLLEYV